METIECIKTRRSRRKYLDRDIDDETLKKVIDVVRYSPSSLDCQPWEIIIVKKQDIKNEIVELKNKFMPDYLKKAGFKNDFIAEAPALIVVCIDTKKSPSRWIEDGVIASMNILLAINDIGLAGVYVTAFSTEEKEISETLKNMLRLPENIMPISIIPIGYGDVNEKLEEKKLNDLNKIVHYNGW